jgi:digalactosyldiacylglycerol synthase
VSNLLHVQVFLNPSTSDVVATTTAEALAMGKWAVVPDIACNAFFKQFKNCLLYSDAAGFVSAVDKALLNEPMPMSDEELK